MIFHVSIEKAEDGWIVKECRALPGCVSEGRGEKERTGEHQGSNDCVVMGRRPNCGKALADRELVVVAVRQELQKRMGRLGNISGKEAAKAAAKPTTQY